MRNLIKGEKLVGIKLGDIVTFDYYAYADYVDSIEKTDVFSSVYYSDLISVVEDDLYYYKSSEYMSLKKSRKQKLNKLCSKSEIKLFV